MPYRDAEVYTRKELNELKVIDSTEQEPRTKGSEIRKCCCIMSRVMLLDFLN